MIKTETRIRVRYGETDRMGFVYYGNYAMYFEVARVECLKSMGISYRELEDSGFSLPVRDYHIRYIKPAYYDDELIIRTCIREMPQTRILFEYETYNESGILLNKAETTLVFVQNKNMKPCPAPPFLTEKMATFFPG